MKDRTIRPKSLTAQRTRKSGLLSIHLIAWLLILACSVPRLAANPLRIYVVTDLEGASGVYQFAQTREPGNPLGEKAKEYLVFDSPSGPGRRISKEDTIEDVLKLLNF